MPSGQATRLAPAQPPGQSLVERASDGPRSTATVTKAWQARETWCTIAARKRRSSGVSGLLAELLPIGDRETLPRSLAAGDGPRIQQDREADDLRPHHAHDPPRGQLPFPPDLR